MELGSMQEIERALRGQCEALDPDAVPLPEVLPAFRALERMAKLVEGAKLRLARKLDDAGVGRVDGCRDTTEFLARATGTSLGVARDTLETSKRLAEQRATDAALARGELSGEQARAVSDAVAADPSAERRLLHAAPGHTIRDLRQRCAQVKANAHPDDRARRRAIHRSRSCRTWTDADGAWNLLVRHLPEVGAEIEAFLAPFTHARFEAGRAAGSHESRDAHRADALLDLARASGTGATPKGARRADTKVFVHIDLQTLQSGVRRPESVCHVDGIGPVDIDHVRSILGEAFVVALVEDGSDIRRVAHLGRQVTARQRSAVEARGNRCEVPGCEVTVGLEIDHDVDWAIARVTTVDDLSQQCPHHHDQHTYEGYRLTGPVGARVWTAPDGTSRAERPLEPPSEPPLEPRPPPSAEVDLFSAHPALS